MVDSSDADRGAVGYGLGAGIGVPRTPLRQSEGRQARNLMLLLSLIFVAGAILNSIFGLASELFLVASTQKTAAERPVVVLAFVAMDFAVACVGAQWLLVLTVQGPRCLSRRKWSKRGESDG